MGTSVFLTGLGSHGPLSSMGLRRPSSSFNKDTAAFHPSDFWNIAQGRSMAIGFFGIPQRRIVWSGALGTPGMERRIGSTQGLDRRRRRVRERNTGLRERNVGEKGYWGRKDRGPEQTRLSVKK